METRTIELELPDGSVHELELDASKLYQVNGWRLNKDSEGKEHYDLAEMFEVSSGVTLITIEEC